MLLTKLPNFPLLADYSLCWFRLDLTVAIDGFLEYMLQSSPRYVLRVWHILGFGKGESLRKKRATASHVILFKHAHVLFKYSPKVYFSSIMQIVGYPLK